MTRELIEQYYLVLPTGIVYSNRSSMRMVGKIDKYGYRVYCLSLEIGIKYVTAHRMVALCYLLNPENKKQINHKDGNKLNNRVTNLEWCTAQENSQHSFDNGLSTTWNKGKVGVYSDETIAAIKENQPNKKGVAVLDSQDKEIQRFDSIRAMCNEMGFDRRTAMRVLKGESNYNTIKGYKLIKWN